MSSIQVKSGSINIRLSPDTASQANILGQTDGQIVVNKAVQAGDFWRFQAFIHRDYVTAIAPPKPPPNADDPDTIPYRSQWDDDGNDEQADCGAACVAAEIEWQGLWVAIDSLPYQTTMSGMTTAQNLVDNFQKYGYEAEAVFLLPGVATPKGAICLHEYGQLSRSQVQDTGYYGWHWSIYLGETADEVIVHDPDRWGSQRETGDHAHFDRDDWNRAFRPYSTSDPGRTAVVMV